jgi:hypothetical protein
MIIGVTITDDSRVKIILRNELCAIDADFNPQDARLISTQLLHAADRAEGLTR